MARGECFILYFAKELPSSTTARPQRREIKEEAAMEVNEGTGSSFPSEFQSTRAWQCGFATHDCFQPQEPMRNILRAPGTKLSFDSSHPTAA